MSYLLLQVNWPQVINILEPSTFKYSPLDRSQASIRQIKILPGTVTELVRCNLRHVELLNTDFIALSYQWGSPTDTKLIEINQRPFRVRRNLHDFLTTARKKGVTTSFWIDAICIDQDNILERNEQVKLMGQIYSTAKAVWVWLGVPLSSPTGISVSEMFDLSQPTQVRDLSQRARIKMQNWRTERNEAWLQTVMNICSLGYWNRVWIIQEFLKAKFILVCIGDDIVRGEHFQTFIVETGVPGYQYPPQAIREYVRAGSAWKLCMDRHQQLQSSGFLSGFKAESSKLSDKSLEEVLATYALAECSDWHDRVYGILALVEKGGLFPVDYLVNKVTLLANFLRFEPHEDWPRRLATAELLTTLLGISSSSLLRHTLSSQEAPDHAQISIERAQWMTIPLCIRAVVDRPFLLNLGKWVLSNRGKFKGDPRTTFLSTCSCPQCVNVLLPTFQPGDEIYQLDCTVESPAFDNHTYLMFRPASLTESGHKYLGAVSARSTSKYEFLLHSLPYPTSEYEMQRHLRRDPKNVGDLLLEIDPQTLHFLINCLLIGRPESRLRSPQSQRRSYGWDHRLTFWFSLEDIPKEVLSELGPAELANLTGNSIDDRPRR